MIIMFFGLVNMVFRQLYTCRLWDHVLVLVTVATDTAHWTVWERTRTKPQSVGD